VQAFLRVRNRIVILDAAFEAILGTVLVLGDVFGHIDGRDFPSPGTDLVIAVFGLGLIGLAVALAQVVARDAVTDAFLRALAAANAGFAVLLVLWVVIADGFTSSGLAIIWVTVAMLLLLALMQALEVGRPRRPS
jgi:drug/metabolite transporter (DMT)-like permease